jgi:RNA polymerase sigma-70 factor (ECF subfamily)
MRRRQDIPLESMTPEELAARSKRGSMEAFARLVAIFEARLFNFILRKVGNRVEAEDLTQETFLRAWKRIGSYRSRWRFSTWLYTIAARLAISHARRGKGPGRLSEDDRESPGPAQGEDRRWVWKLVDEVLTEEQRTAVWLRYVEDMGIGEIATVMGKSEVSVRVMLFRARAALAESIEVQMNDADSSERLADATGRDAEPRDPVPVVKAGRRVAGGVR